MLINNYVVKFASPSCVRFISFVWLSASHDLRLGMDGMLLALCNTGSRDRANVPLIIREFRKPFPELIFPSHLLKYVGTQK